MGSTWTRDEAIEFCRLLEQHAPDYGAHVALTGGCLYKDGPRKDVDILVYRIRQVAKIDWAGFFARMAIFGVVAREDRGWCKKASFIGKSIDFFDAEDEGVYPNASDDVEVFLFR